MFAARFSLSSALRANHHNKPFVRQSVRSASRSATAGIQAEPTRRRRTRNSHSVDRELKSDRTQTNKPSADWWHYLTDLENPKTKQFAFEESKRFQNFELRTKHLRAALVQQSRHFVPSHQIDIPELLGPYAYFTNYAEGDEIGSVCRIPGPLDGNKRNEHTGIYQGDSVEPSQTIVDLNTIADEIMTPEVAQKVDFVHLKDMRFSANHERVALTLGLSAADERYIGVVKDLNTNHILGSPHAPFNTAGVPDDIVSEVGTMIMFDNDHVVYTQIDPVSTVPNCVYLRTLGTPRSHDRLLFAEADPLFAVYVSLSKDGQFVLIETSSKSTSEMYVQPTANVNAPLSMIQPRTVGLAYHAEHWHDRFILVTNWQRPGNFGVAQVSTLAVLNGRGGCEAWEHVSLIKTDRQPIDDMGDDRTDGCRSSPCVLPRGFVHDVDVFDSCVVVHTRENTRRGLLRLDRVVAGPEEDGRTSFGSPVHLSLPDWAVTVDSGRNEFFKAQTVRLSLASPAQPRRSCDVQLSTGHVAEYPTTFTTQADQELNSIVTRVIHATAADGVTQIPITLSYLKDMHMNGNNPTLVKVYGACSFDAPVEFEPSQAVLLKQGWVLASAHVRGGGELGIEWYDQGRLLNKPNTFSDFIAATEHLIQGSWTSSDKLVAHGYSAGGMVLGAVANQRPDLFRVMILKMPFVDVLDTMFNDQLPLTVLEYDEWGNPNEPEFLKCMQSYDPIHNLKALPTGQKYPSMYVSASLLDQRVPYWGPFKYVSRMRELNPCSSDVVLEVDADSGHMGIGGRFGYLNADARALAFAIDRLGLMKQ